MRTGLQLAWLMTRFLDGEGDPSGNGAAVVEPPAAPAAPAAAPEPTPHQQDDRLTPVQRMAHELRGRIAAGEIGFEEETPPSETPSEAPTPPSEPQAQDGTPPAEAAGTGEGGEPATDYEIELPPRRPGGEAIALKVPDQETADALRMMRNGFMRAEEVRAARDEIAQAQGELRAFQRYAQVDPVGLVLEHLPQAQHVTLVEHLLSQPGVLEAVTERLEQWQDPNVRERDAARMETARTKRTGEVQREMQAHAFNQRVLNVVTDTVDRLAALAPADLAPLFRDDALGDIAAAFRREPPRGLPTPEQLTGLLERRLKLIGVPRERVASVLSDHQASPNADAQPRPKGAAAEQLATSAQGKTVDGRKLVQASATRKAVAAATPAGGAAPSATRIAPPKGLKLTGDNNIFSFLRQNVLGKAAPR